MTVETQRAVLRMAVELGFTKFSHVNKFEEISESVLFGAYGKDTYELTPSTEA